MTEYPTIEDLLGIAEMLGEPVVRDLGLLEAAVARPQASAFGADAYPDLHTKAAALLESIVRNHALVDGNKRLGWVGTGLFYRLNRHHLLADRAEAFKLVIAVAEGHHHDVASIATQLARWAEPVAESAPSGS